MYEAADLPVSNRWCEAGTLAPFCTKPDLNAAMGPKPV
jgi:hypothetical protein